MEYRVKIKSKIIRNLQKLPTGVQEKAHKLILNLKAFGPIQHQWPNYGKLSDNEYHCHLSYSCAACWKHEKGTIFIEVYYVGSREKAPY